MTRYPGSRGQIQTTARVFPPRSDRTEIVRAFVADALGDTHPCRPDATLLAGELAEASRTGVAIVISYARRWVYVNVRPIGRTHTPSPGLGSAHAAGVVAGLEARSVRWGLVRESKSSAVWFELDARRTPARPHAS
ncbi:MAG TPA: hypothetical protein VGL93_09425 [Streptosporangiaceae bacterium]|jgi:hypothetical protein